MPRPFASACLAVCLSLPGAVALPHGIAAQSPDGDIAAVEEVLDALHQAAARADFDAYFGFLGTDATERWDRQEFMSYARKPFAEGRGWTYTPIERHVYLGPEGVAAWFDERLENAGLGETRGTGVLVKENGSWRIAQYNLTIPIPNDLARRVVEMIRDMP